MWQAVKPLGIWVGSVFVLELFFFCVTFGLTDAGTRVRLSRSWRVTTGTVVAVNKANHNSITVRYTVNNRQIQQAFNGSEKSLGDIVEVYYSPSDWHIADIENPTLSVENDLRFLLLSGLVLGTLASVLINFRAVGRALVWPWTKAHPSPRFVVTWIGIAVLVATLSSVLSAPVQVQPWLARGLVVLGAALLCTQAFRMAAEISWYRFLRSPLALLGVLLVVVGQVVQWTGQH